MRALLYSTNRLCLLALLAALTSCATDAATPDGSRESAAGGPAVASTSQALTPVAGCIDVPYGGRDYRWCAAFLPWLVARDTCRSYGLDLVSIESATENQFVAGLAGGLVPMWIGANDIAVENSWRWSNGDVPFLNGPNPPGTSIAGRYENFPLWEPVLDGGALDCANIRPGTAGAWLTTHCLEFSTFVCETIDGCPGDPNKTSPGVCNCGVADTNTDGDTLPDCVDGCPRDRLKTEPGINGCGVPDTDIDGDGVPPPFDGAPNDPSVQRVGTCGTPAAPRPAGTPCADAPCLGRFTCNGAGRCGSSCPLPTGGGSCTWREFQDKGYWFCTGPTTWTAANTACRNSQGQHLVEIDSSAENAFVTANLTADAWIGAHDTTPDRFRWTSYTTNDGARFWDGAASGKPYYARYAKWASGQPGGGAGEACGAIIGVAGATRGQWDDRPCTQTRGFVCEVPGPNLRITTRVLPPSPKLPELYGLPVLPEPTYAMCVPESAYPLGLPTSPADKVRVRGESDRCFLACQNASSLDRCKDQCAGVAEVPLNPASTCPPWSSAELSFCRLTAVAVPATPVNCLSDAQCDKQPLGFRRCGFFPIGTPLPDGHSRTDRVCGAPDERCPDPAAGADPMFCSETAICDIQNQQTLTTLSAGGDLTPGPVNPDAEFGVPPEDPPTLPPYSDQSNPCPGGFLGACNLDEKHPWCDYDVRKDGFDPDKELDGDGRGRSGDASPGDDLISFYFDPKMMLTYKAGIGALGLPTATLTAEAGLRAGIDLGPVVVDLQPFDVVDVLAAVDGTPCDIKTERSHMRVFETDFVPMGGAAGGGPVPANKTKCNQLSMQFEDSVDRANKALRDAAYLIRHYRMLPPGTGFGSLCQQLAQSAPRGFPASANCLTETPETTIARFVEYYRSTVLGFAPATGAKGLAQVSREFADLSLGANANQFANPAPIPLFTPPPQVEELTITRAQFFVGPIPCNLEVYAALHYGANVNLTWALNPGGAIDAMLFSAGGNTQTNIARVQVNGEPYATALFGVFAGVGFDVGFASAKFGVDARLTLGTVSVPAFAGAGINLGAENDPRALPADLDLMSWGDRPDFLIPPKRYSLSLSYGAGLSAVLQNVLDGSVHARLKLKFVFFSKSWSKRLFGFTGMCPTRPEQGVPNPCEFSLVGAAGAAPLAAFDDHGWDKISMPSPFPALLGPAAPTTTPTTTIPALTGPVEEFFYDSLCTCIENKTDQKTGLPRECVRNDDCCSNTPRCFSDPAAIPASSNVCVPSCRVRTDSCNVTTDCCNGGDRCFNDPIDALSYGQCRPCRQQNQSCNNSNDCCGGSGLTCINKPGDAFGYNICDTKATCGRPCDSPDDCGAGLTCDSSGSCRGGSSCPR